MRPCEEPDDLSGFLQGPGILGIPECDAVRKTTNLLMAYVCPPHPHLLTPWSRPFAPHFSKAVVLNPPHKPRGRLGLSQLLGCRWRLTGEIRAGLLNVLQSAAQPAPSLNATSSRSGTGSDSTDTMALWELLRP